MTPAGLIRRQPRALQAATRLAVGRSIVPREPAHALAESEQPVQFPDYISPFAATVLFGSFMYSSWLGMSRDTSSSSS